MQGVAKLGSRGREGWDQGGEGWVRAKRVGVKGDMARVKSERTGIGGDNVGRHDQAAASRHRLLQGRRNGSRHQL